MENHEHPQYPRPVGYKQKQAEHHWLDIFDGDGHYFGRVILQWCPAVKRWTHSGDVGTGIYLNNVSHHWRYVSEQVMPE